MTAPICHRIKGNDRTGGFPKYICFMDTETDHLPIPNGVINTLSFGVAEFWERKGDVYERMNGDEKGHLFFDRGTFTDLIHEYLGPVREQRSMWIFAHNMDFDYQILDITDQMTSKGWKLTKTILEAPPFMVSMKMGGDSRRLLRFVDSMNWFRMSLKSLAKPLGMTKGEDAGPGAPWQEREEYCRNDVAILREAIFAWIRFCKEHDLGMFTISQASQALQAFRHRFMKQEIFVNHEEEVSAHERAGYFGARTEMFVRSSYKGRKTAHLDVNSLYPSVMRGGMFPTKLVFRRQRGDLPTLFDALDAGMGAVATVKIRTEDPWYPVRQERIVFPTGTFWTTLCTPELKRAREHGHILEVGRLQVYEMGEIFTEFVDYFYAQRLKYKEEGSPFQLMCKIFLNSLYGKFGQMSAPWVECDDPFMQEVVPRNCGHFEVEGKFYRNIGGYVEEKATRVEAYNAFCAIAAHVTSAARMVLLDGMLTAGMENVIYVDTDSIFCTMDGKERMAHLIDPGLLGAWKDEGDTEDFVTYGAKDYVLDGEARRKGVRSSAQEISPGVFVQEMFVSYTGALGKGHAGEQRVMTIQKRLSREYNKGLVDDVTGVVYPLVMYDSS